jgi:methyl-accepting chemotaxis protein
MKQKAAHALNMGQKMVAGQKQALAKARTISSLKLKAGLALDEDATHLLLELVEAKALASVLEHRDSMELKFKWREVNKNILKKIQQMAAKIQNQADSEQIISAKSQYRVYEEKFLRYLRTRDEADKKAYLTAFAQANTAIKALKINQRAQRVILQDQAEMLLEERTAKSEQANQMIHLLLQARELAARAKSESAASDATQTAAQNIDDCLAIALKLKNQFKQKENRKKASAFIGSMKAYQLAAKSYNQAYIKQSNAEKAMVKAAEAVERVCLKVRQESSRQASAQAQTAEVIIPSIAAISLIFGVFLAFFLTRSITKPLEQVISGLTQGAREVSQAAEQVSMSSHSLAGGASQQAANLEETSASLEEMASMTRTNSENAQQADRLAGETNQAAKFAEKSMNELTKSMDQINQASKETAGIIKTIDDIAFQTNLLALNAAVEAARAGEAGAGFAVVADEVRTLAMRAAEASGKTSEIIEDTISKADQGADVVAKTQDAFAKVRGNNEKLTNLINEIASASQEQTQGIDQTNRAVGEMDQVTQQNAANAEESASASEQLNSQAEIMLTLVTQLERLAGKKKTLQKQKRVKAVLPKTEDNEPDQALIRENNRLQAEDNQFPPLSSG